MRILHISETNYEGGAGKSAYALHEALRATGVDSFFLAEVLKDGDAWSRTASGLGYGSARVYRFLRSTLDLLPLKLHRRRLTSLWTVGWLPRSLTKVISAVEPDIIHVHWTSQILPIAAIKGLKVPVVITHRDWGHLTGGCKIPGECRRFVENCGECPLLRSKKSEDISFRTMQRRRRAWRDVDVISVAVGSLIGEDVAASALFGHHTVRTIFNGIDLEKFQPRDQAEARSRLGIPADALVFLFGAYNQDDPNKGGALVRDALEKWSTRSDADVYLLTAGLGGMSGTPLNYKIENLGFVGDEHVQGWAYAAADAALLPSYRESFGKMFAEAQACGLPVIAYGRTGACDVVKHLETGYLMRSWDVGSLVDGVDWFVSLSEKKRESMRCACSRHARENFSLEAVLRNYLRLYNEVLAKNL